MLHLDQPEIANDALKLLLSIQEVADNYNQIEMQ
jgi:hypothetical protein